MRVMNKRNNSIGMEWNGILLFLIIAIIRIIIITSLIMNIVILHLLNRNVLDISSKEYFDMMQDYIYKGVVNDYYNV